MYLKSYIYIEPNHFAQAFDGQQLIVVTSFISKKGRTQDLQKALKFETQEELALFMQVHMPAFELESGVYRYKNEEIAKYMF